MAGKPVLDSFYRVVSHVAAYRPRVERPMHILIAEDEPALAEGLTYALRRCGHAVDCVQNGSQADAALAATHFDLLMPARAARACPS